MIIINSRPIIKCSNTAHYFFRFTQKSYLLNIIQGLTEGLQIFRYTSVKSHQKAKKDV